jgi:anti-sigma regulatory factor (Ser/Thr protein kinase)
LGDEGAASEGNAPIRFAVAPTLAAVGEAEGVLRFYLSTADVPPGLVLHAELVLEEMLGNVVRHAGLPPDARIDVEARLVPEGVRITVEDRGPPFDPVAAPERPPPASLQQAEPGGLGLKLIRRMTAACDYGRTPDGRNRFSVVIAG